MLATDIPARIPVPFANAGTKNTIPDTASPTPGLASFTTGFPPLTMTPLASGGIPPAGNDFNGVLYRLTLIQQWQNAGGLFTFNTAFSTSVGGYPKGAVLLSTDGATTWISKADNNTTDPDGVSPANWGVFQSLGITAITGLTNANVTLTAIQAARPVLTLAGTLTGNVQIIFPVNQQPVSVMNNTTGAFTVTCKTAAGTGSIITQGGGEYYYGDGTNLVSSRVSTQTVGDNSQKPASTSYVDATVGSIQSAHSNLKVSATGTNASITVSYNELTLGDGAGRYKVSRAVSGTINTAAAAGANGIDTGVLAASTWYYVFRIAKTDGTEAWLFSLSDTAPTMPTGYTLKARFGAFRTDATVNKFPLSFIQYGRIVKYKPAAGSNLTILQVIATSGGAVGTPGTTLVAVPTGSYVPTTAVEIALTYICSPGLQVQISSSTVAANGYQGSSDALTSPSSAYRQAAFPLESTNIYWATSGAATAYAAGWLDNF